MKNKLAALVCLSLVMFVAAGCGKKADTQKPIEEVQKEAQTMSKAELESTARAYANEIAKQTQEVDKVKDQLKELAPAELLGEKAKAIKADLSKISSELSALTQRYDIYAKKFTEVGGDMSAIKVQTA